MNQSLYKNNIFLGYIQVFTHKKLATLNSIQHQINYTIRRSISTPTIIYRSVHIEAVDRDNLSSNTKKIWK